MVAWRPVHFRFLFCSLQTASNKFAAIFCFVYRDFDGHIEMFRVNVVLDRDLDAAGGGDIPGMTYIMLPCCSKIPFI